MWKRLPPVQSVVCGSFIGRSSVRAGLRWSPLSVCAYRRPSSLVAGTRVLTKKWFFEKALITYHAFWFSHLRMSKLSDVLELKPTFRSPPPLRTEQMMDYAADALKGR